MFKFKSITPFETGQKGNFLAVLDDGRLVSLSWTGTKTDFILTEVGIDDQRPKGASLADAMRDSR